MQGRVIIVTGVSGSGKTTVGKALAQRFGAEFHDGDQFHPPANVAKMSSRIPLNDDDREPWLKAINSFIRERLLPANHSPRVDSPRVDSWRVPCLVIACSALKERYRSALTENLGPLDVQWVHLQGSYDVIYRRMNERKEHFMSADMLRSQFDAYEQPLQGIKINVDRDLDQVIDKIVSMISTGRSEVGLIGLGVMGTSLARNIASRGFTISIFNRHVAGKEEGVAKKAAAKFSELANAKPFDDLQAFVESLHTPRKIILMVNAGKAVDDVINNIGPFLQPGDTIVDGGNSLYKDTEAREKVLTDKGIHFVGSGISGGEEGALRGPSIMPGGSEAGCEQVKHILSAIAARNDQGEVCCGYIGKGGAGHFVKMVHNGIEYAEMQLITEVYAHLRYDQDKSAAEIADIFEGWNKLDAASYLLGITVDILRFKDADGLPLIDKIADAAGNKGTGSWTAMTAAELGIPGPAMAEALFARYVSSFRHERLVIADLYARTGTAIKIDLERLYNAYMFGRIINHQQGIKLIRDASGIYGWNIDTAALFRIWSGGCIIRSRLLDILRKSTVGDVLIHPYVVDLINRNYEQIKSTISEMLMSNRGYPVLSSCLEYFKLMSSARNATYLIQAQRDYFGAHTYHRIDDPDGNSFHTHWY